MINEQKIDFDWVHPPSNFEAQSLYGGLPDRELTQVSFDLVNFNLKLEFDISPIIENIKIYFQIDKVASVRATRFMRFYFSQDEQQPIATPFGYSPKQGFQIQWREESIDWHEFESILKTDPLQISDAALIRSKDSAALKLGGFLNGDKYNDVYCSAFIKGKSLTVYREDGEPFSLEIFAELADQYWDS